MKKVFAKSMFTFSITALLALVNLGCSSSVLNQNQEDLTPEKPKTSQFLILKTRDVKILILTGALPLPFRSTSKNNVVLSGKHAYVTTERHLHVIDVSNPQQLSYVTYLAIPSVYTYYRGQGRLPRANTSDSHGQKGVSG